MKTLKLFILVLLTAITVKAQSIDKYTTALQKGLTLLDSAATSEQYITAGNYFERIAGAEHKQWLAQYYSSYTNLLAAITSKASNEIKDQLYDKAMGFAEKAEALAPDNSEVYVLKGYITFMKMSVEPQARAMSMIPQADGYLNKAIALNPENPRAYLVRGQDTFYTPKCLAAAKPKQNRF
jgi:tetratricopeptide (TPR) repeat protein